MKRLLVMLVLGMFVIAACGDSDDDSNGTAEPDPTETAAAADPTEAPTEAPTEEPTAAPTEAPTEEPATSGPDARPATMASAVLAQAYFSAAGGVFDPAVMGFDVNEVTAEWYQADGFYIVVYEGLDLDSSGPLCPGNSIQLSSGAFQFVSNAPTDGADCSTFPTLSSDPAVGVLTCEGVVSYRTAIPATGEGVLFGTIEKGVDGAFMGITSLTPTSAGVPEVDASLLSC